MGAFTRKTSPLLGIVALFFFSAVNAQAQRVRGELRLEVRDPHGAAVSPAGELISEANGIRRAFVAGPEGRYVAQDLPFGVYRLSLQAEGFAPWSDLVEIRSEVPVRVAVTLGVAPVTTQVQVNDSATLVDPYATGTLYSIGRQAIEEHDAAQPGRELLDLVAEQPGWVYEANGVLHPRGSEYDVQFVVSRMARAGRCERWKFLHREWRGGNFLCAGSRAVFGRRRGVPYGSLSRSSGARKLYQPGKCRGILGFL